MRSIFSVDVEDWFNISAVKSEPDLSTWDSLPSGVERDFGKMLDIFAGSGVKVTCFFLGYFAQRFPHLVKRASAEGHEIASHGFAHKLVFDQNADEFYDDVIRTRLLLEDICGESVKGYRAPAFSVTERSPWFFEKLTAAGYKYDSSVFPAPHGIGGMKTRQLHPHVVHTTSGDLIEFPISAVNVMGKPMCFFGGGYLRLFPYSLIKPMALRVLHENRPVVFYVHPREINPHHQRLPMNLKRRFKSYVNLKTTEPKIRSIFQDFQVTTFRQFISEYSAQLRR
jgi:polysaccharide deacetylase family protein (PEP-CTERM system associated)